MAVFRFNMLWVIRLYKNSKIKQIYEKYFTSEVHHADFQDIAGSIDNYFQFEEYDIVCANYEYELKQWR